MTKRLLVPFVPLLCAALATAQAPPATPVTPAAPPQDVVKPAAKPKVYDEQADAAQVVAAAVARAKRDNQRVLVQWGANWCGWCVWLSNLMKADAKLAEKLRAEYVVVHVDVGRFDKHLELAKSLGAQFKSIPYLSILGGDGKAVVHSNTEPFELKDGKDGAHHDVGKLLEFLTAHQAKLLVAADVRAAGFARAKAENKRVFLHIGAPWCGFCHRLEAWMAQPDVAPLLAKDFVDVKIDQDRMTDGKAVAAAELARAGVSADGIPWFVFYDAEGKLLAHSTGPKGNCGFPITPDEIAHFGTMLRAAKVNLTDADVDTLLASLNALRAADEARRKQK